MANSSIDIVPASMPVSVILGKGESRVGAWSQVSSWIQAVLPAGVSGGPVRGRPLREGVPQTLWTGLRIDLHADATESYWHNLMGEHPSVFVICRGDPAEPALVTVSADEADAHLEGDDSVLCAPLGRELYLWLERYVVGHYQPGERKKRKRKNWSEEEKGHV